MRLLVAPLALLSACGSGADEDSAGRRDDRIDCRIGSATRFERVCSIEYVESERGRVITIRKPDGGFRRLLVTGDGRGVVAADGAEPAVVTIIDGGRIDVAVGGDHFRLPATVKR